MKSIIKLKDESIRTYLMGQPETGMGYQKVKCFIKGGLVIDGVVENCEYLVTSCPINLKNIEKIEMAN